MLDYNKLSKDLIEIFENLKEDEQVLAFVDDGVIYLQVRPRNKMTLR
jgi:hypothetical protein